MRSRTIDARPPGGGAGAPYIVPWGWLDVVGAAALFVVLSTVAGGLALNATTRLMPGPYLAPLPLVVSAASLVAAVVTWTRARRRDWARWVFGHRAPTRVDVAIGAAAGVAMVALIPLGLGSLIELFVAAQGGKMPVVQQEMQSFAQDHRTAPLLLISAGLVAPLGEEAFFRGLLFPVLRRNLGPWPAVGASGAVFSAIHFQPTLEAYVLTAVIVLPVGMTLARLYEWRATLWVPIIGHAVYNLVQVVILIVAT